MTVGPGIVVLALAIAGCGPAVAVADPSGDGDGGGGEESTGTGSDGGDPSSGGGTATTTATTGDPDPSAGGSTSATTGSGTTADLDPPPLVAAIEATVTCADDERTELFVEAVLDVEVDGCGPPPADIDLADYLLISLADWDGLPGTIEVGDEAGVAHAVLGKDALKGTIEIAVWAPTHPSTLTLDLAGPAGALQGVLDIEACVAVNEAPCG
jgi:hypothetical protein